MNILDLIERETHLSFARRGKEYHGPCPFCRCTGKQFVIYMTGKPRYWCRQCDVRGDAIQFMRDYKGLSFRQAKERLGIESDDYHRVTDNRDDHQPANLRPPSDDWMTAATSFLARCQAALWADMGRKALTWLHGRGLNDDTIRPAGLGYNAADSYADRQDWGLLAETSEQGRPKGLWLPRGIVIPWYVDGSLWGVRIRRPTGDPKYYWVPGGAANTLYGADALSPGKPAMLLEGEIDALTVQQQAGDLVTPVATGSTHAARRAKWVARLSLSPIVLIAYDADDAGEAAAAYWRDALPNARRWRPYWADANDLAQAGVDLRAWVQAGLPTVDQEPDPPPMPHLDPPPIETEPYRRVLHLGGISSPKFGVIEHMTPADFEQFSRVNTWGAR
jgi:hypothetical protein